MSLKLILDTLEGVEESLKPFYTEADGKYRLDVEGYQDPGPLLRAKQHERDAHNATKAQLAETQERINELEDSLEEAKRAVPKRGQEDAVEQQRASYEAKITKLREDHQKQVEDLNRHLEKTYKDDMAMKIAAELSDTPDLLAPFIEKRLQFELGASGPETRVLDPEGKLSANSVEELAAEFKTNAKFAALIRGSGANGGGTNNGSKGASGPVKPEDYTEAQRVKLFNENPTEFRRIFGQH